MSYVYCRDRKAVCEISAFLLSAGHLDWLMKLAERFGSISIEKIVNSHEISVNRNELSNLFNGWELSQNQTEDSKIVFENQLSEWFVQNTVSNDNATTYKKWLYNILPIDHILNTYGSNIFRKVFSAYDFLKILFSTRAIFAVKLIAIYGKEAELVIYDYWKDTRFNSIKGQTVTISELIDDFTAPLPDHSIIAAAQEIEVIGKNDNEAIIHVKECEWARYFNDHYPSIGYLFSCSCDEIGLRGLNENIRFLRTKTLMQGDSYCNAYIYDKTKLQTLNHLLNRN